MGHRLIQYIGAVRAALKSPIRHAAVAMQRAARTATETLLDEKGLAYFESDDPSVREAISNELTNHYDVHQYIRKIVENRLNLKYKGQMSSDEIEELVDSALVEFFANGGVASALEIFDPTISDKTNMWGQQHKGWDRFGRWLIRRFMTNELNVAYRRQQRQRKTTLPTEGNGNPMPLSLDATASPNSKYTSEEYASGMDANTPSFLSYRDNKHHDNTTTLSEHSTGRVNYHTLLREVGEHLQTAREDPNFLRTPEGKRQITELESLKADLLEIVAVVDGEEAAEAENFQIYKMPDRDKAIGLQDGSQNRKRMTTHEMEALIRVTEEFFQGLPEHVTNLLSNRQYKTHKLYTESTSHADPEIQKKVSQALIGAMAATEGELHHGGRGYIVNPNTGESEKLKKGGGEMNARVARHAKQRMEQLGVPPEVIEEVIDSIMSMNTVELGRRVGDADEMRRFFTYDQLRQHLGKEDFKGLNDDEIGGMTQSAFDLLEYGKEGVRPWGRGRAKGSPQSYLAQAPRTGYDQDEFRRYMGDEVRMLAGGNPTKKAVLPDESSFFQKRAPAKPEVVFPSEASQAIAAYLADSIRIAQANKTLVRCARSLDRMGRFAEADGVERLAASALLEARRVA